MSREWKNRSCCSARLSIFKRLKISIFRHQPRKRWGEATRRDGRSKQRRDVPGGSGAAAPGTGTARDTTGRGCGHREMRDCRARCQGMLSPKRGCSASRWDDQPKGRRSTPRGMPGPKVGCSAPGGDAQHSGRMAYPPQHHGLGALMSVWDGMLGYCTWISPQERDGVPTVRGRMCKSHLQNPTTFSFAASLLLLSAQAEVLVMLPGLAAAVPSCSSLGSTWEPEARSPRSG